MAIDRSTYDSAAFSVANGQTNRDIKANEASTFNNVPVYRRLELRVDGTVTIRLSSTSNDGITIGVEDSPYVIPFDVEVTNLYVTNASGATVNIKLLGTA